MTKALHRHGSTDARVKSFYLLVLMSVASTLLVHMAFFQKHTQTNQLANDYPLIVNHRLQQTPLYLKPSEAIFIPEPLKLSNPSFQLIALSEIHSVVDEYMRGMNNNFVELSRLIYKSAIEKNRTLLTLQIGGMDGVSNDPMHEIFKELNLSNWFPVVVEPVPTNFNQLKQNYADTKVWGKGGGLFAGTALVNYAVTSDRDQKTCEFCHWDDTSTAQKCIDAPDWIRLQLGTLDCAHLEQMMGPESSNLCIVHDPIQCGTVLELFSSIGFEMKESDGIKVPIGLLQIDVEGFEVFLLQSLMDEILDEDYLPLVIHFEKKVMLDQDVTNKAGRKVNGTKIETTFNLLRKRGYVLFNDGEDVLAIRSSGYA